MTYQIESSTPLASVDAADQEAAADNTVLIRGMDLDVFKAAKEGKTDVLSEHNLDQILTPTKNTVLHIYIAFASSPNYVEPEEEALRPPSVVNEILQMCPELLLQKNESGETALHIAARHGCADIIYLANELKRNGVSSGHRILSENNHDGQKLKENKGGPVPDPETNKSIRESHLIVATLVATVTFAAGVTMPGGYYQASDQVNGMSNVSQQNVTAPAPAPTPSNGPTPGYAVLTNNTAFRLFVIFNMLALCLSTFSVLTRLFILTLPKAEERFKFLRSRRTFSNYHFNLTACLR
ncbi:hypothetical protein GBA52_028962 [Prunus armeniaca]|nr:hypothetical protein GBA52_028962 [Prunus armeniaca]